MESLFAIKNDRKNIVITVVLWYNLYIQILNRQGVKDVIKKEMIAMLLAGGQGSRLGVLTADVAKPAVSFGGK